MTTPPLIPAAPSASSTSFAFKAAIFGISLVIFLGAAGLSFRLKSRQAAQLEEQLAAQRERAETLAVLAAQNAKYQSALKDLAVRINTIQALQEARLGPVELMQEIGKLAKSASGAEFTSVSSEQGRLLICGRAESVKSAALLLSSCKNSPRFKDVQLRDFYRDNEKGPASYRFEFDCNFSSSQVPERH